MSLKANKQGMEMTGCPLSLTPATGIPWQAAPEDGGPGHYYG